MTGPQPGNVVRDSLLNIVLWLITRVLANPGDTQIEQPPRAVRVKAIGKLEAHTRDEPFDRIGKVQVSCGVSRPDVVGAMVQFTSQLQERNGPSAVLHVAQIGPVLGEDTRARLGEVQ